MTQIHQQLQDALAELDSIHESIKYTAELELHLVAERQELIELEQRLGKEQRDVDKLEKEGVTSWIRKLIGNREESIDKEREEYNQASNRHVELFKSIELQSFELDVLKKKQTSLEDVEKKVAILLGEREKEALLSDVIVAGLIKGINEETIQQEAHLHKLENLNATGQSTLTAVVSFENLLDDARDLCISSKAGSTPLTYDTLENARVLLKQTHQLLARFKKELSGMFSDLPLDATIIFENFGSFAYRPIFTNSHESTLLQKINHSRRSAHDIREQLENVLTFLDNELEEAMNRMACIENERRRVILSAN